MKVKHSYHIFGEVAASAYWAFCLYEAVPLCGNRAMLPRRPKDCVHSPHPFLSTW